MAEGLPSNNVLCAWKDHDGFLWFGTWYGLCRFDGVDFLTYNQPVRTDSDIPPRKVESIAEDRQGMLWLKTVDWKLSVFNRRTTSFHTVYDELKKYSRNLQVIKIQQTDDGHILLLMKDKTLLMGETDSQGRIHIRKLFDSRGKVDSQTLQLKQDVWAETRDYLCYIGRDYRIFTLPQVQARKQHLSLATAMAREAERQQRLAERQNALVRAAGLEKYIHLYLDSDSLLWVCSASEGIYCLTKPRQQFQFTPLPEGDNTGTRCLYQTRQGQVIVGTRSRNVYLYDANGQLLQTLSYSKYGIGAVYHAMEDQKGRLWLSTKGDGLVLGIPDSSQPTGYRLTHFRHDSSDSTSISGNNVYMTYADSQQHIWVCTLDGGLNLVEESGETDGPAVVPSQSIRFYHKHRGFRHYPAYGLYTEVRNVVEDAHGCLWVGTQNGLMSLRTDFKQPSAIDFHTYRNTPGATFANNDIYTLFRDSREQIWVGAFGGGLQQLAARDGQLQFSALGPREGLRNDVIFSIVEDHNGHLWLATEGGLSCFNQQTGYVRNFDRYDGIPNVEMEEASSLCCNNGTMWIGCKQGILMFSPDQLQVEQGHYRTFILDVVADNQSFANLQGLPYTDHIELEHDHNAFTVEFAALNYRNNAQVNYRYRLEGFDRDWRYSGPHRVGSYNEVPPGNYTFVVEAIDDDAAFKTDQKDGAYTPHSSARLSIRILPPWWQTWWAYLIYAGVVMLIAWVVIRTILQMNRMRNEIYISQRLAKLTTKPDEGDEFIDRLHHVIRENIPNGDFNIDDLAQEMGLSRSAFYKKVKSQTGFAPVDLIKEFRISHAAELLGTTSLSITEVAYRSGFKDAGYFGKCFRKRYGMSPREYVNQQSGKKFQEKCYNINAKTS